MKNYYFLLYEGAMVWWVRRRAPSLPSFMVGEVLRH